MTSRRIMTASEIEEIYSPAPFRYDIESLLNWAKPYTLPIAPPSIEALLDSEVGWDPEAIAQTIIDAIEASRPSEPPGLKQYLHSHYAAIDTRHTDELSKLKAKRQFLQELQEMLIYKRLPTDEFSGIHIYTEGEAPAHLFELYTDAHIDIEEEFDIVQGFLYALMRSVTAAQVEIILGQSLKSIHHEIRALNSTLASYNYRNAADTSKSNTITLSTTSSIQLTTPLGSIAADSHYDRQLVKALRAGISCWQA